MQIKRTGNHFKLMIETTLYTLSCRRTEVLMYAYIETSQVRICRGGGFNGAQVPLLTQDLEDQISCYHHNSAA